MSKIKSLKIKQSNGEYDSIPLGVDAVNIDGLKETLLDMIYPIGSYYITEEESNPNELFGGEWEQIKSKFLFASGVMRNGKKDVYAGDEGGSWTHDHGLPQNTGEHIISSEEMPRHTHSISSSGAHNHSGITIDGRKVSFNNNTSGQGFGIAGIDGKAYSNFRVEDQSSNHTHTVNYTGNGYGHSHPLGGTTDVEYNEPPYRVCNVWKRIA